MYLAGYTLDNLSLMGLAIATGFVVDDAIVVIENITRHIENGMQPMEAALKGAEEIGFTVLSMSISLIAVFIPILMMSGIVGRLFREFAVVLAASIFMSLLISLTTTPMMCARMMKPKHAHGWLYNTTEKFFQWILSTYASALEVVLRQTAAVMVVMASSKALLEMMAIEGAIVTIDAMGCQREIAQKIIDKKADYILALKGNQGSLRDDVELFVAEQKAVGLQ